MSLCRFNPYAVFRNIEESWYEAIHVGWGMKAWDRGLRQWDGFDSLAEPVNNTGRLKSSKQKAPVSLVKEPEVQS